LRSWFWCLMPLSTIFQLHCDGQFFLLVEETEYLQKTIDMSQVTDKLYHIMDDIGYGQSHDKMNLC
jgi:hypothetical protein